ncbi:MAG TPA: hypothetical protein VHD33_01855 [Legionellaceae bacterium]|nr:hypothetical protein [Legionellaceae bacterium]
MDPAHKAQEVGKIEAIYVQNLDAFALPLRLTRTHDLSVQMVQIRSATCLLLDSEIIWWVKDVVKAENRQLYLGVMKKWLKMTTIIKIYLPYETSLS